MCELFSYHWYFTWNQFWLVDWLQMWETAILKFSRLWILKAFGKFTLENVKKYKKSKFRATEMVKMAVKNDQNWSRVKSEWQKILKFPHWEIGTEHNFTVTFFSQNFRVINVLSTYLIIHLHQKLQFYKYSFALDNWNLELFCSVSI